MTAPCCPSRLLLELLLTPIYGLIRDGASQPKPEWYGRCMREALKKSLVQETGYENTTFNY